MKRRICFVTALMLSLSVILMMTACGKKPKTTYVLAYFKGYDNAPEHYYYYANGELAAIETDMDETVYDYQYREDGSLEKKTSTCYSKSMDEYSVSVTEYDEKGNLTATYEVDENGGIIPGEYKYENFYDEKGRIQEIRTVPWEMETAMRDYKIYTYWEDGSWELEESDYTMGFIDDEVVWLPHCQKFTTYNADGLVVKERITYIDMEQLDLQIIYEYDSNDNLSCKLSRWLNLDGTYSTEEYRYNNSYSADGKLLQTKVLLNENGSDMQQLEKTITYTYNEQGLLTEKLTHNELYDYENMDVWEYDENGNLTHFKGEEFLDGGIGKGYWEEVEKWFDYQPLESVLYVAKDKER